jgi:uncharacterized protein YdeI (YjbR/CyaY-like superfamily)
MKTLLAQTPDAWRAWLSKNHASATEIWLVFNKQHTGQPSIAYADALDEALCFGWIDSLVKRIDDRRYARKFTPRTATSRWSAINRKRYAELRAAGRLQPPGIERAPTDHGYDPPPGRRPLPTKLPSYIQDELAKHPKARRTFGALPSSERRRYFAWIESAKRDETKRRRLAEAIGRLTAGKTLGLK